jgi:poly(3-hydroxybutyrate) depolymerase
MCDATAPADAPLVPGTNCRWLALDGVWRRYVVEVPNLSAWPADRAWPVVLMLHGARSNGERMWRISGWVEQARAVGAVVVFPTAWRYLRLTGRTETRWHTWALPDEIDSNVRVDGYPDGAPYPARDIAFMRALLDDVGGQLKVDPAHVHASGFSNGGKFVNRVGIDMASRIGSVTCAGYCDSPPARVDVDQPVPTLYGLGSRDPLVLADLTRTLGDEPTAVPLTWKAARPVVWSLIEGHLRVNGLDERPTRIDSSRTSLSVLWRRPRTDGRPAERFRFLVMADLRHKYAAGSSAFSFAAISWTFFRHNPLD